MRWRYYHKPTTHWTERNKGEKKSHIQKLSSKRFHWKKQHLSNRKTCPNPTYKYGHKKFPQMYAHFHRETRTELHFVTWYLYVQLSFHLLHTNTYILQYVHIIRTRVWNNVDYTRACLLKMRNKSINAACGQMKNINVLHWHKSDKIIWQQKRFSIIRFK